MMKPLITVVVCTYNRAELLPLSLETLQAQTLPASQFEIIVVDNNSTDHTWALAQNFAAQMNHLKVIKETNQGLSHARNLGWHEAQADYVAYIDDDCQVSPTWGAVAAEVIQQFSPPLFGGPAQPLYLTPRPHWFLDRYAERVWHGDLARNLNSNEHLGGMNIVFRKSLLQSVYGFNPNLGMTGTTIAYGEETDVVLRARQNEPNLQAYYDPRLVVHHAVRPEKMTLAWKTRQSFANGYFSARVFKTAAPPSRVKQVWAGAGVIAQIFIDGVFRLWLRDRVTYPAWQNFYYEQVCQKILRLGQLWGQI